jgi:hypothetical protein
MFALAVCRFCDVPFTFNPDLVPSVYMDPVTGGAPDVCECNHHLTRHVDGTCLDCDPRTRGANHEFKPTGLKERLVKEPICRSCVLRSNVVRVRNGLAPITVLRGAYDPTEELP